MDAAALHAREAALSAAGARLDAELRQAAVDEPLVRTLRACAVGGRTALADFCVAVEGSPEAGGEACAVALVEALADADAAERAVRAAAWAMAAQRLASASPWHVHEALELARVAMPLPAAAYDDVRTLGDLTACANTTDEPDVRDGQRMQFSRASLEHVIAAATYRRPARRDLLHAIAPWTASFQRGIKVCDAQLREHEQGEPGPAGSSMPRVRRGRHE